MSAPALRITSLTKRYGKVAALDDLSFEVPRGALCGLVGPNGAGKTTTFGIVGGYVKATSGAVDVLGEGPLDPRRHAGRVTLLPQDAELSPFTTVRETLRYYGQLQGLGRRAAALEADRVLDAVDLLDRAGSRVRQLSHGMRRRVQVAQAFLGSPELVLLDEPMGGLDPHLVVRMRSFFQGQRGQRTLVISSHVLHELEAICDHVVFLERGRCLREGPLDEITGRGKVLRVRLDGAAAGAAEALNLRLPSIRFAAEGPTLVVEGPAEWSVPELNRAVLEALFALDQPVLSVAQGRSLEETWMAGRTEAGGGDT